MGAITLDEYKKILKEKSQQPQTNNTGTVTNQRVAVPNTISFNDYKSKYSPQLPTQATLSGNTVLLPTMENKVQPEQYVDTGKRYGDYFYQDYATRKNDKIYSKGGKYYVFNSKTNQYEDIDSSSKSTITTVEEKNRQKEEAKKLGYKDYYEEQDKKIQKLKDKYNSLNKEYDDNIYKYTAPEKVKLTKEIAKAKNELEQAKKNNKYLSVSDRINLDTGDLTKKEYKEYSADLQRQREKIENEQAEQRRVRYSGTGIDALKQAGSKAGDLAYTANKEVIEPIKSVGDNVGDVTKTIIGTAGEVIPRVAKNTVEVGKEVVKHPIQSTKTLLVGIAEGADKADDALNKAGEDFSNWLLKKKKDNKPHLSLKEYNRLVEKGTKEEKQQVLESFKNAYGEDSEQYKLYAKMLNTKDTRSKTIKTIDEIVNPKYYNTKTYKQIENNSLSEEQQKVLNVGENIGNMLPSMVVSTVATPAAGSAMFYVQAQQNYTEEAKQRGYDDKKARIYGLIMGGVETGIERLGFDQLGGLGKLSEGSLLKSMGGEALEEFATPYVDHTIRTAFGEKVELSDTIEESITSAVYGAVVGGIMNMGGKGIVAVDKVVNKINNNQQITTQEMTQAINAIKEQNPNYFEEIMQEVPEVIKNNINTNTETTTNESSTSKVNNQEQLMQRAGEIVNNNLNNLNENIQNEINNQNNIEQNNMTQTEIRQKIKDLQLELKSYEQVSQDGTFVGATDEVISSLKTEIKDLQNQLKNQTNLPTVEDIVNQEKNNQVRKTNNLNEYIEDISSREAIQNQNNKQSVKENIINYLDENNITNPTKADMMDAMDWYDTFDASEDLTEINKAEKLYSEVADELLRENKKIEQNNIPTKEDLNNSKTIINNRLSNEVDNALTNRNSKSKVYLGKVSQNIATKIKNLLGIDVNGRKHVLSDNDIRHIMNEHGNQLIESSKGQIAITPNDIKRITEIIETPTDIVRGTDNRLGKTIRYIKRYNDNTTYVVEVVPNNSNTLKIKTMWKKPSTVVNSISTPNTTSETKGSDISSTSTKILPQNDKNVKLLPTNNDMQNVENNAINLPTNEDMNLRSLESTAPEIEEKNTLGYIPQDPTRESSYDNDAPNFWELDNKKDSLSDPITEFARALDREIEDNTKTPKQIKKTNDLKSKTETMWSDFQEKFVNRNYEIDKLAKKSGNREIMYKGDMLNSVAGETSGDINVAQTDNYGKRIGPSLKELFKNSKKKGYYEQFDDYLKHYSNIDRHAYGKGSVVPLEYSQKMVKAYEQSIPGIKNEATKVWQYGKNMLNNMEENGLISEEFKGTLEELYPHYVPYMQSESMTPYMDDSGEIKPKKVIKTAKGGADNLITIEDAFERYTYAQKKAIRQNDLFKEIVKTSKEKVSFGADDRIDPTQLDGSLMKDAEGNSYVTAYIDGAQQQAKINDNLYQELTKANELKVKETEAKYSPIVKPLQKISGIRRNILTTWNPSFIATNAIKDIQDGLFNSKYTTDMIKNYPGAFYELATQSTETAQQFTSLYGSGMVMGDYQIDSLSKAAKNMDINQLNKIIKALPNANEIVELAPRYAEFKASLENGCSVTEAMYNAREVTTNFNRGGYITKALNRDGFTFLNASVQGFDKLIRNLTGANGTKGVAVSVAGVMTKVAVLGIAPAMFNAMAFGEGEDDEDEAYKALPDYIKDNYYLFKIKGIKAKNSKYYDGEFLRIPKGRVLSVFGSAARRTLEYSKGDKDAFDGYLKNVESQIGINNPEENNIIAPIKQAFGSKNGEAWYGGDLVPKRLQNKPVAEQYDEGTDEFSKWLGKMINVSPYKINYLLDQYSGGAGDIVLPMITKETTNGATTTKDYLIAPIKDKFIVNSTDDNKYASKFYTKLEKLQTKSNSYNVSENDKLKYKYMNSISSDMSKLYKEKREVQLDDSLTKKQKYKKVQSIQKEINRLAEEGIKEPKIKDLKSHYVKVNNTEYYKNSKGSWTNIKEEEASELKGLRMSANEKSNYFKTKNKIGAIRSSDLDSSVKKDKISNLIINMNMSDDKLAYLYGKYYSNEKTLDMIQDAGISMREFIKFNNQKFESDYYTNGKTVKNSKLAKTINYVNTLNLNVAQKAILIKMKNNSYKQYDKQIVEYLNTKNISYLDKAAILKKIGFKAYDKQIISKINSMNISKEEKIKMLKEMGFTIRNGRVYS